MTAPKPIGWVNEAGILFPLVSYKPEHANDLDAHKAGWRLAFAPDVSSDCSCVLPPDSLEAARRFGAGLNPLALEQPSEVL